MADMEIVNLPATPAFRDDALLVVYVPGSSEPAQKLTGAQLREYAERAAANVKKGDKGDPGDVSSVNGVKADSKGNVTLTPAQIGALPLNGSAAMTGNFGIKKGNTPAITFENTDIGRFMWFLHSSNDKNIVIANRIDDTHRNQLIIPPETAAVSELLKIYHVNGAGTGKTYNIFHTGNKPSGSYTGNGSATSRTIDTGGIGNVVMLASGQGTAFLTFGFAIVFNATGGITVLKYSEWHIYDGGIVLATTNPVINGNGITVDYQVL